MISDTMVCMGRSAICGPNLAQVGMHNILGGLEPAGGGGLHGWNRSNSQ